MTKKILYVQTSGPDSPERLYPPLVLATTARAMGVEAIVYFLGKGILAMRRGEPQKVQAGSFPTLKEVIDQAVASGVKIMICSQSAQLFGAKASPEEFEQPSEIVGAATLNDLVLECDAVLTF